MTGDEAYYWEWSRHLAGGYVDHPPGVALTIAAFAWMGQTPLAVRLGFVLCGIGSTLLVFAAATRLARDARAGYAAALAVTLTPLFFVAFGTATPDGPYLLAWSASCYCAVLALETGRLRWFVFLGLALGATLMSRLFGLAVLFGVIGAVVASERRGALWPKVLVSVALAFVCWVPYLAWNDTHGWASFVFAIQTRHEAHASLLRPLQLAALCALAFSPGLFAGALAVAVRLRVALVAWTSLPLAGAFFALAFREQVEVYWFYGPYLSLCIGLGVAFAMLPAQRARRWTAAATIPAIALCALLYGAAVAPLTMYAEVRKAGVQLHGTGPFEVFTYQALAHDLRGLTTAPDEVTMTDGYGFSSVLDFYGHIEPVVIGYDVQGRESQRWYPSTARPHRALFVDKAAFAARPDFVKQFSLACAHVRPGPPFVYGERRFFTTWCDGMKADGMRILRWQGRNP